MDINQILESSAEFLRRDSANTKTLNLLHEMGIFKYAGMISGNDLRTFETLQKMGIFGDKKAPGYKDVNNFRLLHDIGVFGKNKPLDADMLGEVLSLQSSGTFESMTTEKLPERNPSKESLDKIINPGKKTGMVPISDKFHENPEGSEGVMNGIRDNLYRPGLDNPRYQTLPYLRGREVGIERILDNKNNKTKLAEAIKQHFPGSNREGLDKHFHKTKLAEAIEQCFPRPSEEARGTQLSGSHIKENITRVPSAAALTL